MARSVRLLSRFFSFWSLGGLFPLLVAFCLCQLEAWDFGGNELSGDVVERVGVGSKYILASLQGPASLRYLILNKLPSLASPHFPHSCVWIDNNYVALLKDS